MFSQHQISPWGGLSSLTCQLNGIEGIDNRLMESTHKFRFSQTFGLRKDVIIEHVQELMYYMKLQQYVSVMTWCNIPNSGTHKSIPGSQILNPKPLLFLVQTGNGIFSSMFFYKCSYHQSWLYPLTSGLPFTFQSELQTDPYNVTYFIGVL